MTYRFEENLYTCIIKVPKDEYKGIKKEMRGTRICNYDDLEQRANGENKCFWAFVSKEMVLYLTSKDKGEESGDKSAR